MEAVGGASLDDGSTTLMNFSPHHRELSAPGGPEFEAALLDSYERHFVLPAFLWAHGFPFRRQNAGSWGCVTKCFPRLPSPPRNGKAE
jgi:hypothetical protein